MIDRSEMEKRFYVSSFDGLRAIGILSIIIYHLYSYRLPGGFLGLGHLPHFSGLLYDKPLNDKFNERRKDSFEAVFIKTTSTYCTSFNCNACSSVHLYYTVSK